MKLSAAILLGFWVTLPVIGQTQFLPATNAPDLLYWAFQENINGTGGTSNTIPLADSSQHGGTIGWLQQPYTVPWESNQIDLPLAVHFNGLASILYTTNNADLFDFTTNDFSVYFNINPFGGGNTYLPLIGHVNTGNPAAGGWYIDANFGKEIRLHMENGGDTFVSQNGGTINGWTQIVVTRHGTNVAIYSNGLPSPLRTGDSIVDAASSPTGLQVGNLYVDSDHTALDGNFYQIGIWSRALDLYAVQDIYNQQFPNLVEDWKLFGNMDDSSWYANTPATFATPPVFTTGPDGIANHAAQFDGSSQYLTAPMPGEHPSFGIGLSFWIKPAAIFHDEDLFQWASDITPSSYAVQSGFSGTNGQIYCQLSSDGVNRFGTVSSVMVPTNVWTHVAFSWFGLQTNGGYPQIYINGIMDTNTTFTGVVPGNNPAYIFPNTGIPFQFGRRFEGGQYGIDFNGAAANIQVYKNGLTPAEVWANYSSINGHIGAPLDQPLLPPVRLNIQTSGTNLLLSWDTLTNQVYQLEQKDDLAAPAWTAFGDPVIGTGGTMTVMNNFVGLSQRFFRLRLGN